MARTVVKEATHRNNQSLGSRSGTSWRPDGREPRAGRGRGSSGPGSGRLPAPRRLFLEEIFGEFFFLFKDYLL